MAIQDLSIKRKTVAVIMLTSVAVPLLTTAAFTVYDLATYRANLGSGLTTTAAVVADHSSGALSLRDHRDARATLTFLRADPRIVVAALYDREGRLFTCYPAEAPASAFPAAPGGWLPVRRRS